MYIRRWMMLTQSTQCAGYADSYREAPRSNLTHVVRTFKGLGGHLSCKMRPPLTILTLLSRVKIVYVPSNWKSIKSSGANEAAAIIKRDHSLCHTAWLSHILTRFTSRSWDLSHPTCCLRPGRQHLDTWSQLVRGGWSASSQLFPSLPPLITSSRLY